MNELKQARKKLDEKVSKPASKTEETKAKEPLTTQKENKFVRVAIQEESDEEEGEEQKIQPSKD